MKMVKAFVTLCSLAMSIVLSMATDYTVGGPNQWSESTDLQTWAAGVTCFVGDNLIFKYTLNHDVAEVSKADYDSCTITNPLLPPFTGGSTTIPLTTPGRRYFICQTSGHCITGMKLQIDTLPAATPPPATLPSPSALPPPPTASSTVPSLPPSHSTGSPLSSPPGKSASPPTHSHLPAAPKASPPTSPTTGSPAPPPASALPPNASSAATRINVISGFTVGFGSILMILNL